MYLRVWCNYVCVVCTCTMYMFIEGQKGGVDPLKLELQCQEATGEEQQTALACLDYTLGVSVNRLCEPWRSRALGLCVLRTSCCY